MITHRPAPQQATYASARAGQHSPAIDRRRLGEHLRQLRQDRSLLLKDVAAGLDIAPSTLSRIETGRTPTRTTYLHALLDLYSIADLHLRGQLMQMAREGQCRERWADIADVLPAGADRYLGFESAASHICVYSPQVIPGLLRTEDYAAAVIRATRPGIRPGEVRELVTATVRRQDLLESQKIRLHVVLDESCLLRTVGSAQVMTGQLDQLAALVTGSTVIVQVTGLADPLPVLSPAFTLLRFPEPADPEIACTSGISGQVAMATRSADVDALQGNFAALANAALPPADSASLIARNAGGD